ncbi:MAG: hypothetical protein M3169_04140 [Candidatus Eremiobacteraeota bacterium]|nr:hypothetical protein [Candidatus Eremiobacteraeota bacterium]
MIAPIDANVLARPVRLGDARRIPVVAPVASASPSPELALRYSNGVDTVEISRAAFAAYTAFAGYTAAHGLGADGLPVRLPALRVGAGPRLGA